MYSHDLDELFRQADLKSLRDAEIRINPAFAGNWGTVKDWSEQSRYETRKVREAQDLLAAITDSVDGVLPWVQRYW